MPGVVQEGTPVKLTLQTGPDQFVPPMIGSNSVTATGNLVTWLDIDPSMQKLIVNTLKDKVKTYNEEMAKKMGGGWKVGDGDPLSDYGSAFRRFVLEAGGQEENGQLKLDNIGFNGGIKFPSFWFRSRGWLIAAVFPRPLEDIVRLRKGGLVSRIGTPVVEVVWAPSPIYKKEKESQQEAMETLKKLLPVGRKLTDSEIKAAWRELPPGKYAVLFALPLWYKGRQADVADEMARAGSILNTGLFWVTEGAEKLAQFERVKAVADSSVTVQRETTRVYLELLGKYNATTADLHAAEEEISNARRKMVFPSAVAAMPSVMGGNGFEGGQEGFGAPKKPTNWGPWKKLVKVLVPLVGFIAGASMLAYGLGPLPANIPASQAQAAQSTLGAYAAVGSILAVGSGLGGIAWLILGRRAKGPPKAQDFEKKLEATNPS